MGRKKKVQENIEEVKSQSNSTSIQYTGQVTVKTVSKTGKTISVKKYNTGEIGLFTAICQALLSVNGSNSFQYLNYIPNGLMCYHTIEESGQTDYKASLNQAQIIRGIPITYNYEDGMWKASTSTCSKIRYEFLIPYVNLNNTAPISRLALVNKRFQNESKFSKTNSDTICALIDFPEPIQIVDSTNIVIYWELLFESNVKSETN